METMTEKVFQYSLVKENKYVKEKCFNELGKTNGKQLWSIVDIISLEELINIGKRKELEELGESFKRSRKWLFDNHSELIL